MLIRRTGEIMSGSEYVAVDATPGGVRRVVRWHPLAPVAHRKRWIAWGLLVQAVAVAMLVGYAYPRYKDDQALGMASKATVLLVWQQTIHSASGLVVCALAAVVFAGGSVLVARPFARTVEMLVGVVPVAAIIGVFALGALALVIAVFVVIAMAGDFVTGSGGGGGSGGNKAPRPKAKKSTLRDTPFDPSA